MNADNEVDDDSNLDLISALFDWDCDEVLQRIFLHLDPYSLKSCRQVSIDKK